MLIKRKKFCACGCGQIIKLKNTYVKGHSNKGKKMTLEARRKMSEAQKLLNSTPEARELNSKRQKIAQNRLEVKEKKSKTMKIICNSPEARKRNSIAQNKPETKKKRSDSLKIAGTKIETKRKRSEAAVRIWKNKEVREKRIKTSILTRASIEYKNRMSVVSKIAHNTITAKENHSEAMKKRWMNSEIHVFTQERPNNQEKFVLKLLNQLFPNKWKYTGDFSYIINGKNPDFVNFEQNKIIEFNGYYWHKKDVMGEREKIFAKSGYKTMIIWDYELKNIELLKRKIVLFHERRI